MSDAPVNPIPAAPPLRRDEEIALEMMKFVATTTGYGRTGTPGAGFQGGTVSRAEDYAKHLIDLYGQCLEAISPSVRLIPAPRNPTLFQRESPGRQVRLRAVLPLPFAIGTDPVHSMKIRPISNRP